MLHWPLIFLGFGSNLRTTSAPACTQSQQDKTQAYRRAGGLKVGGNACPLPLKSLRPLHHMGAMPHGRDTFRAHES